MRGVGKGDAAELGVIHIAAQTRPWRIARHAPAQLYVRGVRVSLVKGGGRCSPIGWIEGHDREGRLQSKRRSNKSTKGRLNGE